jgi:predicted nucleotidyltransferase
VNIKEVISGNEYNFLRTNNYLNDIMFITFGGSVSYGLNTPESDIDIRGVCRNSYEDVVGCGFLDSKTDPCAIYGQCGFEQYNDANTDTVIYSFNKFIKLLCECNPNVIEMLGCLNDHYTMVSEQGRYLLNNAEAFLSKRAYYTFGHYARGQFNRLKNAIGKDSGGNFSRTVSLADSLIRLNKHLEETYSSYTSDMLGIRIVDKFGEPVYVNGSKVLAGDTSILFDNDSCVVDLKGKKVSPDDVEMKMDIHFDNLSTTDFASVTNEINTTLKEFTKTIGHRNKKKDSYHLNKHAMHLVRLYLMCYDILVNHRISTFRANDRDFLMSIKNGKYMTDSGTFTAEFFNMVKEYDKMIEDAVKISTLPDSPNIERIKSIIVFVNSWR